MHKLKIKILGLLVIKSLAFSSFTQEVYAEKLPQNPNVAYGKADFKSSDNKLTFIISELYLARKIYSCVYNKTLLMIHFNI